MANLPADQRKPIIMDEFNSASCGGIPESNMFGVGLWSADYALQMASGGYSAAYLHTREHGVLYNVWDPPAGVAGASGSWTTGANFYAMLAVTEALQSSNGSRVVDLNIGNSMWNGSVLTAGYAVYDASSSAVNSVVLFNYQNASAQSTDFDLPASFFTSGSDSVLVKYMSAETATETTNINWGNITYAGVGDGIAVNATTQWGEKTYSCSGGCTVQVPGPGLAVVFATSAPKTDGTPTNSSSSASTTHADGSPSSSANPSTGKQNNANSSAGRIGVYCGMSLVAGLAALCSILL
ncbi:hypothetical protein EIP86_010136 [Pleurotus ostreatoroseus]|nr:hypothetical protein EIP86_010136 [Pleurotus ostreatoroseus]